MGERSLKPAAGRLININSSNKDVVRRALPSRHADEPCRTRTAALRACSGPSTNGPISIALGYPPDPSRITTVDHCVPASEHDHLTHESLQTHGY